MFETARLVETLDEPREDADNELPVLRLLVAAESDVEPRPALEFPAGALPRESAKVLEFVLPLRPMFDEADEPRFAAEADEPLLNPRAEFAPEAPKCALEGGATPARLPAL
jgi:hypothetical protein